MVDEKTGIWSYQDATTPWTGDGRGHGSCESLKPLFEKYLDKSLPVIDMGCGLGDYINYLSENGFEVYGFDGTPDINKCSIYHPVEEADLTKPIQEQLDLPLGNVISLEVGEHLPKQYEDMFITNVTHYCTDTLILSWALPEQGGHGHFNEQPNEYVIQKVEEHGLVFEEETTIQFRKELSNMIVGHPTDQAWRFFCDTIMIFRRDNNENN